MRKGQSPIFLVPLFLNLITMGKAHVHNHDDDVKDSAALAEGADNGKNYYKITCIRRLLINGI